MPSNPDEILDAAVAALRAMTLGGKGNRADYVGTVSTQYATAIVHFIDRVRPLYDAHAFGEDELRYLHAYRRLTPEGQRQLESLATHLARRSVDADAAKS